MNQIKSLAQRERGGARFFFAGPCCAMGWQHGTQTRLQEIDVCKLFRLRILGKSWFKAHCPAASLYWQEISACDICPCTHQLHIITLHTYYISYAYVYIYYINYIHTVHYTCLYNMFYEYV